MARDDSGRPSGAHPPRSRSGWRVEGAPPDQGDPQKPKPPFRRSWFWWLLALALLVNWALVLIGSSSTPRPAVPYSFFHREVVAGHVDHVTARGDAIQGTFDHPLAYPGGKGKKATLFETRVPAFGGGNLTSLLLRKGVVVDAQPPQGRPFWQTLLLGFGPTVLFMLLLFWLMRRMASGAGGGLSGIGRIRARRYRPDREERVTFDDVAGIDEAEGELVEIVDFLRNPDRYRRLGGAIPRGVLLSGQPGTGKTLLARALAGEADVPFFSLSASEFVEMIVGVGASRVRDLFEQARKCAPAILFIDELDAIGRARGSGTALGGHDEREQTLNQILTEMDGFTGREGVIVIGATNRPEILDPALLRPGRFDRRIAINPPDIAGREAILRVHVRDVPLGPDVDLHDVAASTPGMVGADLRNLVNEAALTAARRGRDAVARADFDDALERIVLGAERKLMLTPEERERTAYHESGHALLGLLQPGADPVRTVSIVPRGRALGVTLQRPEADRYGYSATYLRGRLVGALGGRAAEELIYGDLTTGAESDLEQVTQLARQMVGRWGMSRAVGPVSVLPRPDDEQRLVPGGDGAAPHTLELVDKEVRRLVDEAYEQALTLLDGNREGLDALAHALLERETLDREEIEEVTGITPARRDAQRSV